MATFKVFRRASLFTAATASFFGTAFAAADSDKEHVKGWLARWDGKVVKGWQLTEPHESLLNYTNTVLSPNTKSRVFVPLCGKDVSVAYLSQLPSVAQVVGVEASSIAIEEFSEENPNYAAEKKPNHLMNSKFSSYHSADDKIMFKVGDFFDASSQQFEGKFDVIYDRASMVAITPNLRASYVGVINELLKKDGKILLVTVDRRAGTEEGVRGGPPFSINQKDVEDLYSANYKITLLSEKDMTKDPVFTRQKFMQSGQITSFYELTFLLERKSEEECELKK